VLAAVNDVLHQAIRCRTVAELCLTCLERAEALTGAAFGWIGMLNDRGRMDTVAQSDPGWAACRIPQTDAVRLIEDMPVRGIWGWVIEQGHSLCTDKPAGHPAWRGLPAGHPELSSYLGVPLVEDGRVAGVISLGNRPGGFREQDRRTIEAFAATVLETIRRKRAEIALHDANARLGRSHDQLRRRVDEQAHDLAERVKELECLYGVAAALRQSRGLEQMLAAVAGRLPAGWHEPPITRARVTFEGRDFDSQPFTPTPWCQREPITVGGRPHGEVAVYYTEQRPEQNEGPFLNEERELLRAVARTLSEAVERQQAEQVLEEERARLLAVLDGIDDVIYVADPESYELLHVNQAGRAIWGEDIVGGICYRVLHGRESPCPFCTNEHILGPGLGETHYWESQNQSTGRWFRCADKAIHWVDGRLVRFELAGDITPQKQLQAELEQLNRELNRSNEELQQFAYVASHDLQEPLRMVRSFTELLAKRYGDQLDERAHGYMDYIVDGAERMQRLIADLLAYSRVQTQGKRPAPVDSGRLLDEALRLLEQAIADSGATVERGYLPQVAADPTQLTQVLLNLVGNALKFRGPEPPLVRVAAGREDTVWHFRVSDNGIGLEPGQAERIFKIFQRLHGRGEYPGTGIGLALVRRIVERHGGRVWADSAPDSGSTFHFTLPVEPVFWG
jgi:signal transduction histidine kinase